MRVDALKEGLFAFLTNTNSVKDLGLLMLKQHSPDHAASNYGSQGTAILDSNWTTGANR